MTGSQPINACPLCETPDTVRFHEEEKRLYCRCPVCRLTFLVKSSHLTHADEYAHYGTHQNDPSDLGYRKFLNRLASQLIPKLTPGATGLDFGAGPGPTLSVMLAEQGFPMRTYDPYFAPDTHVLDARYDFITCTETCEHFACPAKEFARFDTMLRPGGWIGLMTQMLENSSTFADWWYRSDPTHVCFYHPETLHWIANHHGWRLERPAPNIALFLKVAT